MDKNMFLIAKASILLNVFSLYAMEELDEPVRLTFKNETSYPIYIKNRMRDIHLDPKGGSDSQTINITPFTNEWIAGYDSRIGQQTKLTNDLSEILSGIRRKVSEFRKQKINKFKEEGPDVTVIITPGVSSLLSLAPTYALNFKVNYNYQTQFNKPQEVSRKPITNISGSQKEINASDLSPEESLKDQLNSKFNELFIAHMSNPNLFMLAGAYKHDFEKAISRGDLRSAEKIINNMMQTKPQPKK